jgi:glycosyltransferase involved in cell wall biosynthesis
MRVWVAHVGEPLPIDSGTERQLRMSLFAQLLAARGHEVVWWTSTFDHTHKRQRFPASHTVRMSERLELRLLLARPYHSNISLARLINHRQVATAFQAVARSTKPHQLPDVIFATLPTVELAAAAARFGRHHRIPVIVDVRDLHPDIYLTLVPRFARGLARALLAPLYRDVRSALSQASGIIAIAPSFLRWALEHSGRSQRSTDAVFPLAYPDLDVPPAAVEAAGVELRKQGVRPDRRIIWYIGTFNRWIDLGTPIEAARTLATRGRTDVQFVFSGAGNFDSRWRRQTAELPNVVFTGWIDTPKIAYMRQIAAAGLAPYRPGFHTVGNKLFEYMAVGLPVLLGIGGDAKEIIERHQAGVAYDGGSPMSLLDAVEKVLSADVRERLSANGLRAFQEHYSAEKVYAAMADFVLDFARESHAVR